MTCLLLLKIIHSLGSNFFVTFTFLISVATILNDFEQIFLWTDRRLPNGEFFIVLRICGQFYSFLKHKEMFPRSSKYDVKNKKIAKFVIQCNIIDRQCYKRLSIIMYNKMQCTILWQRLGATQYQLQLVFKEEQRMRMCMSLWFRHCGATL